MLTHWSYVFLALTHRYINCMEYASAGYVFSCCYSGILSCGEEHITHKDMWLTDLQGNVAHYSFDNFLDTNSGLFRMPFPVLPKNFFLSRSLDTGKSTVGCTHCIEDMVYSGQPHYLLILNRFLANWCRWSAICDTNSIYPISKRVPYKIGAQEIQDRWADRFVDLDVATRGVISNVKSLWVDEDIHANYSTSFNIYCPIRAPLLFIVVTTIKKVIFTTLLGLLPWDSAC